MTAIATILPHISVHAPEAPNVVVTSVMVDAAREFCRQTLASRADIAPITLVPGTSAYTVTAPADNEVFDILRAKADGYNPLIKTTPRILSGMDPTWETRTGQPEYFYVTATGIAVWPIPTQAGSLRVRAALMPVLGTLLLDDLLVRHYEIAIRAGTLYRLLDMPRRAWTDKGEAKFHGSVFMNEIMLAKHKAANENQVGIVRTTGYGGI